MPLMKCQIKSAVLIHPWILKLWLPAWEPHSFRMEHINVTYMTCKTLQTVNACVWYSGLPRNHRNFEKLQTWGRGQDESFDTLSTLVPVKTSANGLRISQETRRKCISLGVSRNSGEKTRWSDRISCSLAKKVRWESRRCEEGSINKPYLYLRLACTLAVFFPG